MNDLNALIAAEAIRNIKGRYCIALDTKNRAMFHDLFADDAVADFSGAQVDPNQPGAGREDAIRDPLRGPDAITDAAMKAIAPLITVHHCSTGEIVIESADTARATWPIADILRFPPGRKFKETAAFGYYHETYVRQRGEWKIGTVTMSRLRINNTLPD